MARLEEWSSPGVASARESGVLERRGQNSAYRLAATFSSIPKYHRMTHHSRSCPCLARCSLARIGSRWRSSRRRRARFGRVRPRGASLNFRRRPSASTSRARRWSCRSTRCRAPSFRSIDIHGHPPRLTGPDRGEHRRRCDGPAEPAGHGQRQRHSGDRLEAGSRAIKASRYKDRMVMFTGLNLRDVGPGFGPEDRAAARGRRQGRRARARRDHEELRPATHKKADGTRLKIDDPELDPVWDTAARLKIPVFIHVADPAEFFQPLDYNNERWLELALYPDRRYQDRSQFPSFEELMGERDRMLRQAPDTTFGPGPPRLARQRSGAARQDDRQDAEPLRRRWAPCSTTSAASRAPPTTSS